MIRLMLGAVAAVAVLALAIHVANTPWAAPVGLVAAGFGCLLVAREGRVR